MMGAGWIASPPRPIRVGRPGVPRRRAAEGRTGEEPFNPALPSGVAAERARQGVASLMGVPSWYKLNSYTRCNPGLRLPFGASPLV
jgi:hypothetical protein